MARGARAISSRTRQCNQSTRSSVEGNTALAPQVECALSTQQQQQQQLTTDDADDCLAPRCAVPMANPIGGSSCNYYND